MLAGERCIIRLTSDRKPMRQKVDRLVCKTMAVKWGRRRRKSLAAEPQ